MLLLACSAPRGNFLDVDLRTDLSPGREMSGVVVEVIDPSRTGMGLTLEQGYLVRPEDDDFVRGERVGAFEGLASGEKRVRVTVLGLRNVPFLVREVAVDLQGDLVMTVLMTRNCRGVMCPEGTACVDGACQSETCVAGAPGCATTCATDGDCLAASSCVRTQCVEGACFAQLDDGRCSSREMCTVAGCVEREGCRDDLECDDGVPCTTDVCGGDGVCRNEADDAACDDGNDCTMDVCVAGTGCRSTPDDTASCDDGFFCNGADACAGGVCSVHEGSPCPTVCNEMAEACEACETDLNCGALEFGPWGECEYSAECANDGTRARTNQRPSCVMGSCELVPEVETEACSRSSDGAMCASGVCSGGACRACGDEGELCCAADTCSMGTACVGGDCELCGRHAEPCCSGADECESDDLTCQGGACRWPGSRMCVAGTSSTCRSNGGTWTGTQCCFDDVSVCAGGSSTTCRSGGGMWSGTQCCVSDVTQCVAGTSTSCRSEGHVWTGNTCCVSRRHCTNGTSTSCRSAGGDWTGNLCCLDQDECVDGTSTSCRADDGAWTGSACCHGPDIQCVAGSPTSCRADGGAWTGDFCCVPDDLSCTSGSSSSCRAAGGIWTGSLCCA